MGQYARIEHPILDEHEQGAASELTAGAHITGYPIGWLEAVRIGFVALCIIALWLDLWEPLSRVSLIGLAGILIGGWPFFKEAAENIASRRMTMELSMSIAIIAATAISEFFSALVITLFVLVAEALENMTVSRGRRAISDLLQFLPRSVTIRGANGVRQAVADELRVGDSVLVNPAWHCTGGWDRYQRAFVCRPGKHHG